MSQGRAITYSHACRLVYDARQRIQFTAADSRSIMNASALAGLAVPSSTLVRNTGFCFQQGKIEPSTRARHRRGGISVTRGRGDAD
jgi:hypothetical protein